MLSRVRIGFIITLAVVVVVAMAVAYLTLNKTIDGNRMGSQQLNDSPSSIRLIDGPPATTTPPDPADSDEEVPEYCGEDGDCNVLEPSEQDSEESNCIQQGLEWDGTQCFQPQLPEEQIGRVIDGPNGELCTVTGVNGEMICGMPEEYRSGIPTPTIPSPTPPAKCN